MCLSPAKIADVGFVACRKCWQCLERKVDDWVGRNIAESKTAKAAHVVTLTYGEDGKTGDIDNIRAAVLTYSDVQKFLKFMRHDYPVRYFVVGEYGSLKGRAHWHIILYWQDKVPDMPLRKNVHFKYWRDEETETPHGWTFWDKLTPEAIRYACKYLQKDLEDENKQGFGPMPSKKPPLGDAYFRDLASKYVQAGLAPQDLFYSFPDVRRVPHGIKARTKTDFYQSQKPVQFLMRGKTAENFCKYFVEEWRKVHHDEPPQSPVIWAYLDKGLQRYVDGITLPQFDRRGFVPIPTKPPIGGTKVRWCEYSNCHYSYVDGVRLWYSYDTEGDVGWHEKIRPDPNSQERREERREAHRKARYLAEFRGV